MEEEPEQRPSAGDWALALMRVRALWPLPALLLMLLALPFVPDEAWRPQYTTRRTLSKADTAILITCLGCFMYWLMLFLSQRNLMYTSRKWGMREPSEAELWLVETGLRLVSLLIAYAGPALLIFAR